MPWFRCSSCGKFEYRRKFIRVRLCQSCQKSRLRSKTSRVQREARNKAMYQDWLDGLTYKQIGKKHDLNKSTVGRIIRGMINAEKSKGSH